MLSAFASGAYCSASSTAGGGLPACVSSGSGAGVPSPGLAVGGGRRLRLHGRDERELGGAGRRVPPMRWMTPSAAIASSNTDKFETSAPDFFAMPKALADAPISRMAAMIRRRSSAAGDRLRRRRASCRRPSGARCRATRRATRALARCFGLRTADDDALAGERDELRQHRRADIGLGRDALAIGWFVEAHERFEDAQVSGVGGRGRAVSAGAFMSGASSGW